MFSLIPTVYAMAPQGGEAQGPGMAGQFALFGVIFLIFYLLVIRPQQKKAKDAQKMIESLQKGDQVVTQAGIYGKVNKFTGDKDYLHLEIAEKTIVKIKKAQIAEVIKKSNKPKEIEKSKEDNKSKENNKSKESKN